MNLQAIKSMIAQMKRDTNVLIIKGNTTAPRPTKENLPPDGSYAVYNITSPYIKERSRASSMAVEINNELYEKRREEYKFTISFTLYANDYETTMEKAFALNQWFLFMGEDFLGEKDLVPVSVGNIQNRTTFLVDSYEYKCGFDVQFRTTYEQLKSTPLETMESIEI